MGWATVNIDVALPRNKTRSVEAYINPRYPGLAIHDPVALEDRHKYFTITHVPSGMALFSRAKSREKAELAIEAMHEATMMDGLTWDVSEDELRANPIYQAAAKIGQKALKGKPKPRPPRGVRGDAILLEAMEAAGLELLAGGRKYRYYGKWGGKGEPGVYIRMAKRTARVVNRFRRYETYKGYKGKLEDRGVTGELYYGDIARDPVKAQKLVDYYVKRGREFFIVGTLKHGRPG